MWVGALIALLACSHLAPSQARAGCSYYVLHRSTSGDMADHLDPLVSGMAMTLAGEPSHSDGPRRPKPCSGPSCSGWPDSPTPPSVSATKFVEPWAYLAPLWSRPEIDSALLPISSHDLCPIHRGEPIHHPPRSIAAPPVA
ncbi:hypothetical protein [Paludisphaera borealis]|uniref:hypothetical protein n=1 Tax=Paludisphaera borealis TaxID=1387353 RepID=UPI0011AB491B|nr:hypothetical protein [Paludisphaera borealis]